MLLKSMLEEDAGVADEDVAGEDPADEEVFLLTELLEAGIIGAKALLEFPSIKGLYTEEDDAALFR